MISEKEILNFLSHIEQKEIKLSALKNPSDVYTGNVLYMADNSWEITVFNDANTWDYIDNIKIGEGICLGFKELDEMLDLRLYEPPLNIIREVYKIPQNIDS